MLGSSDSSCRTWFDGLARQWVLVARLAHLARQCSYDLYI